MFEAAYRQRLNADLARWQADGVITSATGDAIRGALPPVKSVNIATVVGIVGGLLIAAAFLAFVAANWTDIPRPARFVILVAGIAASYTLGAWFDRGRHPYLADISVSVGTIVFGASIALVGQMYHLSEDFAGGMMLWSAGALVAALLTGSRGALAVALAAGCIWSGMRTEEMGGVHLPFIAFWMVGAGLAVAWNSLVARHLVGVAALGWFLVVVVAVVDRDAVNPMLVVASGAGLLLGGGLALAERGPESWRALGLTLSTYASFALALVLAGATTGGWFRSSGALNWAFAFGLAGVVLAFVAAAIARRSGPAFAGGALVLALIVITGGAGTTRDGEPWLAYALSLASMLCLVVSGMLDEVRPRIVAGWLGLALVIAVITWTVRGSLLRRSVFLAVAGIAAVGLAVVLGRLIPGEAKR